jgi:hypothetical protein
MSEDVSVEHLLDIFTTIDVMPGGEWDACANFMQHLFWYKPRPVVLGQKIEAPADDHPSKLGFLFQLSRLFLMVGKYTQPKRLLARVLEFSRGQGDDRKLAQTLRQLIKQIHSHCHNRDGELPKTLGFSTQRANSSSPKCSPQPTRPAEAHVRTTDGVLHGDSKGVGFADRQTSAAERHFVY